MKIRKKKFPMNRPDCLTWEGGLRMQARNATLAGVLQESVKTVTWLQAVIAIPVGAPQEIRLAMTVILLRIHAMKE